MPWGSNHHRPPPNGFVPRRGSKQNPTVVFFNLILALNLQCFRINHDQPPLRGQTQRPKTFWRNQQSWKNYPINWLDKPIFLDWMYMYCMHSYIPSCLVLIMSGIHTPQWQIPSKSSISIHIPLQCRNKNIRYI